MARHIVPIVEGHGEQSAVPVLLRSICHDRYGRYDVMVAKPVRCKRGQLVRDGEPDRHAMVKALRLATARLNTGDNGAVLVLLDADEDCPAELARNLRQLATTILDESMPVGVVLPKIEFESWFLPSVVRWRGSFGFRNNAEPPTDPEGIRGAKERLSRLMVPGRKYSETVDQAKLSANMDLEAAERQCRSFRKFLTEVESLLTELPGS